MTAWEAHRGAGVRVRPSDAPGVGLTVALGVRMGPLAVIAPCRITETVDSADEFGFTYFTLPGHPEQGEESFILRRGVDDRVTFHIRATSRPADLPTRLAGPFARYIQQSTTTRYLRLGDTQR